MLKILKHLTKKEWGLAVLAVAFIVIQIWLELTMPDYMSEITVLVQTPGSAMGAILTAGGKMLLCAVGSLAASACTAICASRIASNFSAHMRALLFNRVQAFSMAEIGHFSTASLITRSTNDVTQVQMVITMGLQVVIKAPITAVWAIAKIAGKAWQWTASTAVAVAVLLVVVGVCTAIAMPKFRRLQALTDDVNRVTRENLNGLRVVRAYNAEGYQEAKFDAANTALTDTHLSASRTMAFLSPSISMVMSGLSLAIYWIGAVLINAAGLQERVGLFSEMVVFSQYAMQVVMSFMMLVMIFVLLPRASVAARRINEVLETPLSLTDGSRREGEADKRGQVEFRHVSFRYPDAEGDVLHDLSFTVHRGETLAIIGATGCGKSTLINLIPRFYDVSEGEVLVDGVDVREYEQKALRDKIGYVSQRATLFTGSIQSNVRYGDNGREETVSVADSLRIAQAEDFVQALADGEEAFVAQGGSNFSGGQKQRLSIARAIYRDAEILIFDDSFSALDYKTDRALRAALKEHCADATKLIVAQRIGTIRDADQILVLDEGAIVGIGRHEELLASCETYRQIALSQLSEEELA